MQMKISNQDNRIRIKKRVLKIYNTSTVNLPDVSDAY